MGALALHHEDMLIPRDVFITPQLFERRKEILVPRHSVTLLRPEDFAAMMPVADRDFESWLEALAIGDERAVAWLRVHVRRRRAATFSSYSDTYNSGSGTITGPSGVSAGLVRSYGGGGGGGYRSHASVPAGGAGSGSECETGPTAIAAGATLAYSVGGGGAAGPLVGNSGSNGGATTTSSGTGGFAGIAHNAGGGNGSPANATAGTGGSASGGDTNTPGNVGGSGLSGGNGGSSLSGSVNRGGNGGYSGGSAPTAGGAGRFYVLWS